MGLFTNTIILLIIFITILIVSIIKQKKNYNWFIGVILSILGIVLTPIIGFGAIGTVENTYTITDIEPTSIVHSEYYVYYEFDGYLLNYNDKFTYENSDSIKFYNIKSFDYYNNMIYDRITKNDVYENLPKDSILNW